MPKLCRAVRLDRDFFAAKRLASLAAFLTRHGQSVRALLLSCDFCVGGGVAERKAGEQLAACITACGAHAQLQDLPVWWWNTRLPLALPPLPSSLWDLDLISMPGLRLDASLSQLTQLTWLNICADRSDNAQLPAAQPPPTLEWLHYADSGSREMPMQVWCVNGVANCLTLQPSACFLLHPSCGELSSGPAAPCIWHAALC